MQIKRKSVPTGRRSGFTLVELLIVIIIIGILASGMMLLSGSGQDRAEAARIISDLRTLVGAAQSFFSDHPDQARMPSTGFSDIDLLRPYIDREIRAFDGISTESGYFFLRTPAGTAFIGYAPVRGSPGMYGTTQLSGPAKILAGEPDGSGLLGWDSSSGLDWQMDPTKSPPKYNGEVLVLRKAR